MAENWKHLYEQMKKMVAMYQDEIVPVLRQQVEELEKNQVKVRCKDCKHWLKDVPGCTDFVGRCEWASYMVGAVGYCVYGEKKVDSETKQSCTYNKDGLCTAQKMMPECDPQSCDRWTT